MNVIHGPSRQAQPWRCSFAIICQRFEINRMLSFCSFFFALLSGNGLLFCVIIELICVYLRDATVL